MTYQELADIADIIRDSGDEESLRLMREGAERSGLGYWESGAPAELLKIGEENGAPGHRVHDLIVRVARPDAFAEQREWQAQNPDRWDEYE